MGKLQVVAKGEGKALIPFPQRGAAVGRERMTPQSLEAEQAVLGALLLEPGALGAVLRGRDGLRAVVEGDFYRGLHRKIFAALVALHERGEATDLITVAAELREHGELEAVGGAAYLTALIEACPCAANLKVYLRPVVAMADARLALQAYEAAAELTYAGAAGAGLEHVAATVAQLRDRAATAPAVTSAVDLLALQLPEPAWAVPDIVPAGFNILAGKPKIGKSWLALNLAVAVAAGGAALGSIAVERGDVLYLALEDTPRRVQSRLSKLLGGHADLAPPQLHIATTWPRTDRDGLTRLERWLHEHPRARLVVLDIFERLRPVRERGGNSYADDYQAVLPLKALCDRFGVAMLVLHHVTKMPYADPIDSVSGTLGFAGAADGILVLRRQGAAAATLFMQGRDIEQRELALRWNADMGSFNSVSDAETYRQGDQRRQIVDLLREADGPLAPREIAEILERECGPLRVVLFRMVRAGELEKVQYGRYQMAPLISDDNAA